MPKPSTRTRPRKPASKVHDASVLTHQMELVAASFMRDTRGPFRAPTVALKRAEMVALLDASIAATEAELKAAEAALAEALAKANPELAASKPELGAVLMGPPVGYEHRVAAERARARLALHRFTREHLAPGDYVAEAAHLHSFLHFSPGPYQLPVT